MLTGELEPTSGAVWKHPNMRIAYVAQHAFHHIEQHLEKTPNEYIRWRYAIGEDRENLTKVTRQVRRRPCHFLPILLGNLSTWGCPLLCFVIFQYT